MSKPLLGAAHTPLVGLDAYDGLIVRAEAMGEENVVGLHGTNDPSILGSDVSHGCIRVSYAVITRLVRTLPLGTPIEITRS